MPPKLSEDLKQRIVQWYYEDQLTMRDIASQARCSIGLVCNVLHNHREYGQVTNPFRLQAGRPSYLDDGDLTFINTILTANPSLYLDEVQQKLSDVRGVQVSIATVSRALSSANISRKSVEKAAGERNEELRTLWEIDMAQYKDPRVFLALDESAVDNKTAQRRFGWAPIGLPCVRRMSFLRGTRYSILPALSTEGIVALDIFEGSVTKERFLTFLRTHIVGILIFTDFFVRLTFCRLLFSIHFQGKGVS